MLVVANQLLYRAKPVKPVSSALNSQFRKTTTFLWLDPKRLIHRFLWWMCGGQRSSAVLSCLLGHSQCQAAQYSKGASVHPERTLCRRPENKINGAEEHWLAFIALAWNGAVQCIERHPTWDVLVFNVAWPSQGTNSNCCLLRSDPNFWVCMLSPVAMYVGICTAPVL